LLISGEYAVLDGAHGFALPTKFGQKMSVKNSRGSDLIWECLDKEGNSWFNSHISLYDFSAINTTDQNTSDHLQKVLKNAVRLNSEFLSKWNGFKVVTRLEFPLNWGLGSSSTLLSLIGDWADINALMLYFKVESGSGYDVACSNAGQPIIYYANDDEVNYTPIEFNPTYKKNLYFIHLNKKQSSEQGIKSYLKVVKDRKTLVKTISGISDQMAEAKDLKTFAGLMDKHEDVIAHHTGFEKVKDLYFSDYWGSVKSLGAWGGDFVMATSNKSEGDTKAYFEGKGYATVLSFDEMI
jgi:mevalonate kinase